MMAWPQAPQCKRPLPHYSSNGRLSALLRVQADVVICPAMPEPFLGVGRWYEDFTQITDAEVHDLLGRIWQEQPERERSRA